jgi:ABC-type glycerol-3-phosphate transport system substrate-binding protein
MKTKLLTIVVVLLCLFVIAGCSSSEQTPTHQISIVPNSQTSDTTINALRLAQGYGWISYALELPQVNIGVDAVQLTDNTLWFVSGEKLYSAQADGSDAQERFGSVPSGTYCLTIGTDDCIYFGGDAGIYVFDVDGVQQNLLTLKRDELLCDLMTTTDGTNAALISNNDGYALREFTTDAFNDTLNYKFTAVTDIRGIAQYNGDFLICENEGIAVYSEAVYLPAVKWSDIGVVGLYTYFAGILGDGKIMYLNRTDKKIYFAQKEPTVFEKTELSLAVIAENDFVRPELEAAVVAFNSANSEYTVKIEKYASVTEMNVHIIAGDTPDLINVDGLPFETFAKKGLFEDLSPYFDSAEDLNLVPSFRKAMSTDDSLYRVSPDFLVWSLEGISDYIGTKQGWTFDELKQIIADAPEGTSVFPQTWDKQAVSTFLLKQNIDEYVDWENSKALFNTSEFKNLLEFINTFPDFPGDATDEFEQLRSGKQLVTPGGAGSVEGFTNVDRYFGGKLVAKGFPSERRASGLLNPASCTFAICSASANKDGAFAFIRSVLLTDDLKYIPMLQSKFDEAITTAMTEPILLDSPMTSDEYVQLMTFLNGVDSVLSSNQVLQNIIDEETPPYFAGQKTVDEVCEIIQNRAELYINEQS